MIGPEVIFQKLGITFQTLDPIAFEVFGIEIYWYALFICTGFVGGLLIASAIAKRSGQNPDLYSDFMVYCLIAAIVGARLYYVAFEWDNYKGDLMKILNVRQGGLAIYGGIIAVCLTLYVYSKVKKVNFLLFLDTAMPGLCFGQMIGRMGNFVNKEAFGSYTDNVFAMSIRADAAKYIPAEFVGNMTDIGGVNYIQVHPTFLYEALWTLSLMILLILYFKHRKFDGENFFLYMAGYGVGRAWIEGLRTDQLIIGSTGIPVSQLLAAVLVVVGVAFIIIMRKKQMPVTVDGGSNARPLKVKEADEEDVQDK